MFPSILLSTELFSTNWKFFQSGWCKQALFEPQVNVRHCVPSNLSLWSFFTLKYLRGLGMHRSRKTGQIRRRIISQSKLTDMVEVIDKDTKTVTIIPDVQKDK